MQANWKKMLAETLRSLGIVKVNTTGKVVVNFNQGGITDIEKTERLK